MRRLWFIIAAVAAVLVASGATLWLAAPDIAGAARPLIARQIESLTGRELTVAGGMEVTPSLTPRVVAREVSLQNAGWASQQPMLDVQELVLELRLLPLLFDQAIVIDQLILRGATVLIEKNVDGALNWRFDSEGGQARAAPYLAEVRIVDGQIVWRDLTDGERQEIAIDALSWSAESAAAPLRVLAEGRASDVSIRLSGQAGPISRLIEGTGSWSVDLSGDAAGAEVTISGALGLDGGQSSLAITAEGEQLAALGRAIGATLPALGPYRMSGELAGEASSLALQGIDVRVGAQPNLLTVSGSVGQILGDPTLDLDVDATAPSVDVLNDLLGEEIGFAGPLSFSAHLSGKPPAVRIRDISARLGESDVSGALTVDMAASPTAVRGSLASRRLDLQALAGAPGADAGPKGGATEGAPTEAKLPLSMLRQANLHIALKAEEIFLADATIGPASANLELENGRLALTDIDLKIFGGRVSSTAVLEATKGKSEAGALAMLDLRIRASDLDLSKILKRAGTAPAGDLQVDAEVTVDSRGRTRDQLLADLSGEASVAADGGRILKTQLNRLVQDVDPIRILLPLWRRADVVNVRCLVGAADIRQGVASTSVMLDTERMTVLGEGKVDLRQAKLDITLDPTPKSKALSATGVPVDISGPLASPEVQPRAEEAVAGLLGGLLGGLVVPLNQIARVFGSEARDACASAAQSSG